MFKLIADQQCLATAWPDELSSALMIPELKMLAEIIVITSE